ncbi:MAG: aldehyde dehydrogenase family protein [Flavobacteriales bacterium]|nr:aldehyde dehydrogenase family protein [Flavobacteriales bacterium]
MKVINPSTNEVIKELEADNRESVLDKLEKLRNAQKPWAKTQLSERLEIIKRFGEVVSDQIDHLAKTLSDEMGKPLTQSLGEIKGAHGRISHLLENAEKWLSEEVIRENESMKESLRHEPLGVIANISAWNYPYNVGYNVFLYALIAGNAVAYKPSEYASLTGLALRDCLMEAGLPKDVFHCIIGDGSIGNILLEEDLDGYFFTGSVSTGRLINEKVSSKMVPVQLELGGKDPLYVMEDVKDVKIAAVNAAEGAFYNSGQSCCAIERIYVHSEVYDQFVEEFVEEVRSYKVGKPYDEGVFIGPLTRASQIDVILNQVNDAVEKGAKVLTGGHKIDGPGNFIAPTVLVDVDHSMEIMKEESFGPVIGIQKVHNDEEALNLMNDTSFGLTAAVFAENESRVNAIIDALDTGTVYWNCCDRVSPYLPWSGRKNSGLGSTLSYIGIRAFTQPKAYHIRKSS